MMLSADEDVSSELDRVVCRLMKLALRSTRGRQSPLPMKWMQCKMLDLLTLTEKAIEKKKRFESYPLKAICYEEPKHETFDLSKIQEDNTAHEIMQKYRHLVRSTENNVASEDIESPYQCDILGDNFSHKNSEEFLNQTISSELDFNDMLRSPSLLDIEPIPKYPMKGRKTFYNKAETPLTRTQAWVEEDVNLVKISKRSSHGISSGDTDHSMNNVARFRNKKNHKKKKLSTEAMNIDVEVGLRKKSANKTSHKNKGKNVEKCKYRVKTSKTRIIKNVVKKKSSYNMLIKTCSKKISSVNCESLAVRFKRNLKQLVRQESPKLISGNSKDLRCADMRLQKGMKEMNIFKNNRQDVDSIGGVDLEIPIASTKESLFIDIVMDDKEETIALRRTIGTDADDESVLFEQETILGSLMNVMKADSFYNKQETENVHSQTLFIYDINEPSTSKGVRHVSMDVQCGPETTNNTSTMLSATTSFTRIPKDFNTGIKIGDSTPKTQIEHKRANFGTTTCEYTSETVKIITSRTKSVGIKIKDSDTSIKDKVESATMTQENFPRSVNEKTHAATSISMSIDSATETQLLKAVSSRIKMEDSGSEFCESIGSFRKSPVHFSTTSYLKVKSSASKDVGMERKIANKYVRPKLCCGGVHIHSYKEKQTNEDVVYQGEWQRYRAKALVRRRAFNTVIAKRVTETVNKKLKTSSKENITASKDPKVPSKRFPVRNATFKKLKEENPKVGHGEELTTISNATYTNKCNKKYMKVAKKQVSSSLLSKPNKVTFVTKKPSITSFIKKDSEKPKRDVKKNYLPLYLKRKLAAKINNEALKQQTQSTKTIIENREPIDVITEDVLPDIKSKNLLERLNFNFEPRESVSYVVFRNEKDQKANADSDKSSKKGLSGRDSYRRSPSPQSQNSSAYSSSNSIATVRARPTAKPVSERRFPTSSNQRNLNSQCESTPVKNKKFTKRAKGIKKPQDKDSDNKENVPESSKGTKGAFLRNKNVFRAHMTPECSPQIAHNSMSRQRPQTVTKPNVKMPVVPCTSGKQSSANASIPAVSKKNSMKSPISRSSLQSEHKSLSPIKTENPSTAVQQEHTQNLRAETNERVIVNIVDNNLLTEWMSSSYKNVIDSHTNNILAAMRQLVEEKLDFIESLSDVDSKTIVLSKEQLESVSVSASSSFHDVVSCKDSCGTVIENEDNIKQADINDVPSFVNNTFDSFLGDESLLSFTEARLTGTDLDLLSFKSLTFTSKLSEYFLAESTFNNATGSRQSRTEELVSGSVHDIFERRNQLSIQNIAGAPAALAVQAFSGFSMNAEPITGDQPDKVNIIDSETGSLALEYTRQTTSEEVFISGRSSDSYQSCLIDEDAVVPHWLFQIISQQQSVNAEEDEEEEPVLPMQISLPEPMFDVNGNVMEPGMGASAGAGDGRGIHSDHSQDSSGRGTSLSSSATSSGPESEAILIDPTAFTGQFNLTREAIGSPMLPILPLESPDTSFVTAEGADSTRNNDILNTSGERRERTIPALLAAASDVDADISSIDTDVPD